MRLIIAIGLAAFLSACAGGGAGYHESGFDAYCAAHPHEGTCP